MSVSRLIDAGDLDKEITASFPKVSMPEPSEILFKPQDKSDPEDIVQELENFKRKGVESELVRALHQNLSRLSAKTWRWLLPYYLRFCLTPEAENSQMEIEFLVYALSPSKKFRSDTKERLFLLDIGQVNSLINFIRWLKGQEYWSTYLSEDLDNAEIFLIGIKKEKGRYLFN